MRIPYAVLVFLLLAAPSAIAVEPTHPVEATLSLPFETVLPGVPFDMTVTIKNVSSVPAAVGISARLTVTLPDGKNVSDHHLETMLDPAPLGQNWLELAPGETHVCYTSWYFSLENFFLVPDFSGPGVYGLRFQLGGSDYPDNYVGLVVTNTVHVTRAVPPPGEDEVLWQRMTAVARGRWSPETFCDSKTGGAITREILQIHPGSAYYPYALLLDAHCDYRRPKTKDDISKALEAAQRFQSSPAHGYLLLRAAEVADSLAHYAFWDHDAKTSAEYFGIAARYYEEAAKTAKVPGVCITANAGKRQVDAALERQRQAHADH